MKVEPLASTRSTSDRDARAAGGRASRASARVAAVPHPRLRRRGGAARTTSTATMASLAAFNRWLEEDWGFATSGRIIARADALARRSRRRAAPSSTASSSGAPASCTSGRRRCPAETAPPARSATSGTIPVWARLAEAVDPGGVPPRRQRLQRASPPCGAARRSSGLRQDATSSARSSCPTGRSTTRWPRWSSTACSTATRRCGSPASRTAPTGCTLLAKRLRKQANQTPWVFAEDPLDDAAAARVGHAVLRGGPPGAGRPDRRRAHPVRLRLAPRRGPRRADSTSSRSSHGFDEAEVRKIMRDNALDLLGRESLADRRRRSPATSCATRSAPGSASTGTPT